MESKSHYEYEVAISCASEDRPHAEAIAALLKERGITVFFDAYERATLWGKNLYTYFSDLYQHKARYCIMFLSERYAKKLWTNHEREAAQARAFRENDDYILPIRLDDTEVPGALPTTGYLDWADETPESIVDLIMEKLNKVPAVPLSQTDTKIVKKNQMSTIVQHTKVLVIFANPRDTESLRLGEEDRVVREAIKLSQHRDRIETFICHAATIHDIRRALLEKDFDIIHISGHGSEMGLILEDAQGNASIVPQEALAELFSAYTPPLQCVILNACYSISQGYFMALGIPFTIAMEGPISDRAAIEFIRGFYDAIGAGRSIDFAYEEGCRTVKLTVPNAQFISQLLRK